MYNDSISVAQKILASTSDKAHDVKHARRVAENSVVIGQRLDYPDLELLQLCGWWHDVGRTLKDKGHENISANMLKDDLKSRGASATLVKNAYSAVVFHNWAMQPLTVEGNILRDADKLDFISPERWLSCLKAGQVKHLKDIKKLLPELRSILKLNESKLLYDERIKIFERTELISSL